MRQVSRHDRDDAWKGEHLIRTVSLEERRAREVAMSERATIQSRFRFAKVAGWVCRAFGCKALLRPGNRSGLCRAHNNQHHDLT